MLDRSVKVTRYLVARSTLSTPLKLMPTRTAPTNGALVVALTTYPGRVERVHLTLWSLLRQDFAPEKIVLVLSLLEFPDGISSLPKTLRKLISFADERVEVLFTEDNKRSYKKLLPVLNAYPKHVIVTADDDVIYPRKWLLQLYAGHRLFPKAIIGTRGSTIELESQSFAPYSTWKRAASELPSHDVFLTGRGGILYPAGSLAPQVSDWPTANDLCPTADDIWFKAMAILADTKCLALQTKYEYLPNTLFEEQALWHENVLEGRNDKALMNVAERFHIIDTLREGKA